MNSIKTFWTVANVGMAMVKKTRLFQSSRVDQPCKLGCGFSHALQAYMSATDYNTQGCM